MIKVGSTLMEVTAQLFFIAGLYGKKLKVNRYTIALFGTLGVLFFGINVYHYSPFLKLVAYALIYVYCLAAYDQDVKKSVVNYCLSFIGMCLTEIGMLLPVSLIMPPGQPLHPMTELAISTMAAVVAFGISHLPAMKHLPDIFLGKKMFLLVVCLMTCYFIGVFVQLVRQGFTRGTDVFLIVLVCLLLGMMVNEWQKTKRELDRRENQIYMNRLYAEAYEELILLVREKQHDVKNHIYAMQSMIYTTKSYEELVEKQRAYCDYIVDESAMTGILTSIENPLLAGFLYKRIKDAQNEEIVVTYELSFFRGSMRLTEYTIVEMIGILFDNAVESVLQLERQKKMHVALLRTKEKMIFSISNPFATAQKDKCTDISALLSESSKGKGRGIGIAKLKKMVKNADGQLYFEGYSQSGYEWVTISIELPLGVL